MWPCIKFEHKVIHVENWSKRRASTTPPCTTPPSTTPPCSQQHPHAREAPIDYGEYVVSYVDSQGDAGVLKCNAVCVCSGLHNIPRSPHVPGLGKFRGLVMHSANYRERKIFEGKRVLIVGCGETGLDLAYRAVTASILLAIGFLAGLQTQCGVYSFILDSIRPRL